MAVQQSGRWCEQCEADRLFHRERFGDGLALLLTLLSCGLFLPLWVLIAFCDTFKPWRCQSCGSVWVRPGREPVDWEARGRSLRAAVAAAGRAAAGVPRGIARAYRSLPEWAAPIVWGLGAAGLAVGAFLVVSRLR